jgi:Flp pilus assembly protein TadD
MLARFRAELRKVHIEAAKLLREDGRYEASRRAVERVLKRWPGDPVARRLLAVLPSAPYVDQANALFDAGRLDDAEGVLAYALARLPDDPEVHLRLASLAATRGKVEVAARHARCAVEVGPDDPNLLVRAASPMRWHDHDGARECVDRAARLTAGVDDPERFPLRWGLIHLDGVLTFDAGDHGLGIALLERAFGAEPESVGFGDDLAQAYLVVGRISDARATITEALEHRPDDERLLRLRAEADA